MVKINDAFLVTDAQEYEVVKIRAQLLINIDVQVFIHCQVGLQYASLSICVGFVVFKACASQYAYLGYRSLASNTNI